MFKSLVKKVIGDSNEREISRLMPVVDQINALEDEVRTWPDERFPERTREFEALIRERTEEERTELERAKQELDAAQDPVEIERLRGEVEKKKKTLLDAEEEVLWEILPEAFAMVREAARRTIGLRHYDVQLIGGIVLHQGKVAEMRTGEGKTLVATLPLYLNALTKRGVHLVTPNDYLSKVGVQWMGPIYHFLGMTASVIQSAAGNPDEASFLYDPTYQAEDDRYQHLRPITRKEAYLADITYGTNNEFGFDYLRDNMVYDIRNVVQRELHYAIVDEVDSILIDEARTPLIISAPDEESSEYYIRFADLVRRLRPGEDYTVDEKDRIVLLTESGISKIEQWLNIDNLYGPENLHLTPYLENALKAQALFKRDKDYIVKDGEIIIVDPFTGRLMYGRRYSEGLHQAIEAKEGVPVQRESLTYATITFQNFFRMYNKLAGMTGTAATEKEELGKIYNLDVVVIPTNVEWRARQGELKTHVQKEDGVEVVTYTDPKTGDRFFKRVDYPDVIYKSERAKFQAVVDEIEKWHRMGRPVLVGTVAIETSERLSRMLSRRGIPHNVLNAKYHEKEAVIIAQAGRPGAVTIATNMAGRGVDILLGGNPEGLAREQLRKEGYDLTQIPAQAWDDALKMLRAGEDPTTKYPERWAQVLKEAYEQVQRDRQKVWELGGLHVIGTERHEARRIDNQLRGRAGRQGDPGSSRFYVSLEDELMRRFGGDSVAGLMDRLKVPEDMPLESKTVSKLIENAQQRVEGYNFDIRKRVLEFDSVINKQREIIYEQRRRILTSPNLRPTILEMVEKVISQLVDSYTAGDWDEEWDLQGLYDAVNVIFPLPPGVGPETWQKMTPEELKNHLIQLAHEAYDQKERKLGPELMRHAERQIMLRAVDSRWVRHLTNLDNLRQGIGLRALAQENPLVAYKREAHHLYTELVDAITNDIVHSIYKVELVPTEFITPRRMQYGRGNGEAQAKAKAAPAKQPHRNLGRNDPCWCGSGKKYKHCHWAIDHGRAPANTASAGKTAAATAATAAAATSNRKQRKKKKKKRKKR
ncbi:MAG: preprotein translocase subunit SecA [Chloroflexi bacterium]|nr:preprotein translocase subunit SecA [Chloroflexota bacterium]